MTVCVVIQGPTIGEAELQIKEAQKVSSMVEWRLDLFDEHELKALDDLKKKYNVKTIFTLRPDSQGGKWSAGENARLAKLEEIASLKPDYIDVEHTVPKDFITRLNQKYPNIKIIISHHDFEKTPQDLSGMLHNLQMQKADYYKIACMAKSALDTYSLLLVAKSAPANCLLMSMGITGHLSRILAPVVGRPFTYVSLHDSQTVVPGQISAKELYETYNLDTLHAKTCIYGLIGNPVDTSVSHFSHNEVMRHFNLSSVYIKTQVAPDELGSYLQLAKKLEMQGLSVTMPLKETVMQYCDSITEDALAIGAVNTLHFKNGQLFGSNTDAPGALNALEAHMKVCGKKIVVLGAGGAAKAVVWEAMKRGACVIVCNRNLARAEALSCAMGCKAIDIDELSLHIDYDIMINATSVAMPIDPNLIIPGCLAMDIKTLPRDTDFLQEAEKRACKIVYGYEMFIQQAILQYKTWFADLDHKNLEKTMTEAVLRRVN